MGRTRRNPKRTPLRTLLHWLQTTLPERFDILQINSQTVGWSSEAEIQLDVAEFEEAIAGANAAAQSDNVDAACTALERAASYYTGDFLPDCYDEWVLAERERLRRLLLTALGQQVHFLEQRRRYAAAIHHARRLLHLDSLNEAVCQTLMRLHTLNGDRARALRVYHSCVSLLQSELGVGLGETLKEVYERLLAAEEVQPFISQKMSSACLSMERYTTVWTTFPRLMFISRSSLPA